jgi:nitrogen fixation/metabolism regulation signal transduction histidine kinase
VADLIGAHRAHAQGKSLTLTSTLADDLPAQISTDPQRLRQIINNLLNNAIKFTENGEVELKVRRLDDRLAFDVRDSGPVFRPRRRASSSRNSVNWISSSRETTVAPAWAWPWPGSSPICSAVS